MANDTTRNPWVIDTAAAAALIAAGTEVVIRNITWVGPTTAGHEAKVCDANGRVVWHRVCQANRDNFESEFHGLRGRQINGLQVPTLQSGTLYITFFQDGGS